MQDFIAQHKLQYGSSLDVEEMFARMQESLAEAPTAEAQGQLQMETMELLEAAAGVQVRNQARNSIAIDADCGMRTPGRGAGTRRRVGHA